jgi:hypothetical protein
LAESGNIKGLSGEKFWIPLSLPANWNELRLRKNHHIPVVEVSKAIFEDILIFGK